MDIEQLAQRMEQARARRVMSWSEVARRSGISRDTVRRLATGARATPTPASVRAIADGLGVDSFWLASGQGASGLPDTDTDTGEA